MSPSDLVASVESGKLDLNDTAAMDSVPYCRVCMDDNHKTSKYFPIKDLEDFI